MQQVAIVTGASRGIGAATARRLAEAGAALALCDQDPLGKIADGCELLGVPVLAMRLDVRDADAVGQFAGMVEDRFGRVDVLVNNAGGTFHAAFTEVSSKGEQMLIAENFTQVTRLIRLVVPLLPPGGSIINITSSEAHQAAPGFAVYAAMKAALESLTRSLALELAPRGIRVNAIAPDALPTSGEEKVRASLLADGSPYEPVRLPPLGFLGSPDDAAQAVVFLASEAARFITGVSLPVDGGIRAAGGWRRRP